MTSKKVTMNEKPKGTKGVFRRSESVMPAGFNIRKPSTPINDVNTNGKESQPFFRRSESVMPAGVNVRNPSTPINDINANGKESQPFFRRSESVMPAGVNVRNPSTLINDINVKESQPLFRRSSMICSEGFDKYTYDCHRHDIPSRSMVQELKESAFEREIKNSPRNLPLPSTPPTQSMLQELKESAFEREIKNSPRHLPLPSTPSTQSMLQESKESAFEREIKNSPRHLHFPSTPPTQSMLQELKESAFERDIKNSPRHLHFPSTPSTQSMLQELKESAFERETKNSPRNLSLPLILPTLSVAQEIKESAFERETKNSPRNLPHPSTPPALSMVQELKESAFKRETKNSPRNLPLPSTPPAAKPTSILKKKAVSIRSPLIKRDSVVHPGRIDMQRSLCIAGRFQNPWPTWRPPTFTNILKFGISKDKSKVPPKQELELVLPIVKQKFSKLSIPDDGIRVTWIGHSTVLVQMHGLNVLTDPIFSDRASPSQVVGPKRYRDPPCSIHDLPHLNAVVISHSHYDHLDLNTVTLLNARFGTDIRWFVPLGLQSWMQQVGCENVVELDWWEENCVPEHSDTFFVFTPAQHWSKRTIGDDNKVLWGSWCILGPKYRFFFAGDTGYCDVFKQIGRVHGPFDLSAIPIGAYEPRWFMKYQHVNPEEAVQIHMDVRSKRSLAIHWGTFCLANEYYLDPPRKLRDSLDKNEIPPELFFTMKHGESRLVAQTNLVKRGPMYVHNRIEE